MERDRSQALEALIGFRGRDRVIEILGIDEDTLTGLLDGTQEWPHGARERFSASWDLLAGLGAVLEDVQAVTSGEESSGEPGKGPGGLAPVNLAMQVPAETTAAEGRDASNRPSEAVGMSPVPNRDEIRDRRREGLFGILHLARMRQLRVNPYHERLTLTEVVAQIELVLIGLFKVSVPEPGEEWNSERRDREVDKRIARLRWAEREQEREFSGFRGLWNWLCGKKRLSREDLYRKLVAENADLEEFIKMRHDPEAGKQTDDG